MSSWRARRRRCRREAKLGDSLDSASRLRPGDLQPVDIDSIPPRAVRRFIPKQSITVAVNEDGFPLGCGVVRDLSESGACLVTDLLLKRGWRVDLKVNLNRLDVFETRGQVVWSGEGSNADGGVLGAVLHGVQFTGLPDAVRSRLKGLLITSEFDIAPTAIGAADRTPFQEMLEDLQPDLDRLGNKMD